jgi:enterochelin esterase family protein
MKNVPHGTVTYEDYPSAKGIMGSRFVYTPPGFDVNGPTKHPVLYLIHGGSDPDKGWIVWNNYIPDHRSVRSVRKR